MRKTEPILLVLVGLMADKQTKYYTGGFQTFKLSIVHYSDFYIDSIEIKLAFPF